MPCKFTFDLLVLQYSFTGIMFVMFKPHLPNVQSD